jgi:6-pyruvoyltetrahydropterin/6-carboxytetrahydropterin synthase
MTADENRSLYGSLYHDKGWGRRFRLEVSFKGPVDPLTGMIVNLVEIDRWLNLLVVRLSHSFLNDLVDIFQNEAPTPERITDYCFCYLSRMSESESRVRLQGVRLFEDESLSVLLTY